jgi:formylmethanofuran dehydrogenase subunit E
MSKKLTDAETWPVMLAAGIEPLEPYPGNNKHWKCQCVKCNNIVWPKYNSVQQGRGGCRPCGLIIGGSKRRVPKQQAIYLMRENGVEPLEPYPGSGLPWKCRCVKCNSIVSPSHHSVQKGQGACVYCAGLAVHVSDAINVMHGAGVEPLEPYPGSTRRWKCRCMKCNSIVSPRYNDVQRGHGACLHCSGHPRGADAAVIYLMLHKKHQAVKIGIGAARQGRGRVKQHEKRGWSALYIWDSVDGVTAYTVEQTVLSTWRSTGIPTAVLPSDMPQGGWTETAPLVRVNLGQTRRLIEKTLSRLANASRT